DEQELRVGDHHALVVVGVVRRASQDGAAVLDADDPGEGVACPGEVTDHPDVVTDDHRGPSELPGPHGDDPRAGDVIGPVAEEDAPPAAPVDAHDHGGGGVV